MALLLKDGSIFLHIPKTGGNWVTKMLREGNLVKRTIGQTKHADLHHLATPVSHNGKHWLGPLKHIQLRRALQPRPFMFCFVRHPLSWYESWFQYMSVPKRNWRTEGNEDSIFHWHPISVINGCGSPDFNEFVSNVVKKCPGYVSRMYGGFTFPKIDFIGKQENLREDLITALKMRGLPFDEDHIRNSKEFGVSPKPCLLEWDSDLRQEVLELELPALRAYGYDEPIGSSRAEFREHLPCSVEAPTPQCPLNR